MATSHAEHSANAPDKHPAESPDDGTDRHSPTWLPGAPSEPESEPDEPDLTTLELADVGVGDLAHDLSHRARRVCAAFRQHGTSYEALAVASHTDRGLAVGAVRELVAHGWLRVRSVTLPPVDEDAADELDRIEERRRQVDVAAREVANCASALRLAERLKLDARTLARAHQLLDDALDAYHRACRRTTREHEARLAEPGTVCTQCTRGDHGRCMGCACRCRRKAGAQ